MGVCGGGGIPLVSFWLALGVRLWDGLCHIERVAHVVLDNLPIFVLEAFTSITDCGVAFLMEEV